MFRSDESSNARHTLGMPPVSFEAAVAAVAIATASPADVPPAPVVLVTGACEVIAGAAMASQSQAPTTCAASLESTEEEAKSRRALASMLDLDFSLGPWKLHGYIQYDGAAYDQAPERPPEEDFRRGGVHEGDPLRARNLNDGFNLRRARFGGEGSWGNDIAYRAMFEIGAADQRQPSIAEVWVSYSRFRPFVIQVGAFPQPVNMDGATSSDATLFLERATAADLARSLGAGDGRIGVTLKRATPTSIAAISLTGPVIDHAEDYSPRAAIVGRYQRTVSYGPFKDIHIGVNGTYVLTPASKEQVGARTGFPARFKNTPEVDVDDSTLIDTGNIASDHASVIGFEFAAQRGNVYVQAEAFRFGLKRQFETDAGDPHFFGFYVQGSWILTGEARRFEQAKGTYTFPKINRPLGSGGWGALELAFRYSRMDLNYRAGDEGAPPPAGGVRGGDQEIIGAALLWYPRPRVRLMVNYLHVSVDRLNPSSPTDPEPFGPPPATPPVGVQIGQTLNILALRGRYSF